MKFITNLKEQICSIDINKKELFRSVLFLSIVYAISYISIFRANYNYIDDIRRAARGDGINESFSRHISEFLSYFLHTTTDRLTDISPLPQLIACVFLALAGFIMLKVMCKKTTRYCLLATLPIGLSPYFLSCMSYKFDSPYMALSVLVSIVPFLFIHTNRLLYTCVSVLSLLVMVMTYQASSGIFLMMVLYFFFHTVLYKTDSLKNAFIFLGISCASYGVALGLFRLCFLQEMNVYASTDVSITHNIFTLFWNNLSSYFTLLYNDWNVIWSITALIIIVIFYVKTIVLSKLNTIVAFFVTTLFLALLAGAMFGVYPLLEKPLFSPRAMYGVGVFLAILSVDICCSLKKIISFPVMVLSWCFFVFAFAYGNCLADQKRYREFRTEMLVRDLSHIILTREEKPAKITIQGNFGFAGVTKNVARNNPIVRRLISSRLTTFALSPYHNFQEFMPDWRLQPLTPEQEAIPVVFDSFYHTIKKNDTETVVILKAND
jgi:hypothetical protein